MYAIQKGIVPHLPEGINYNEHFLLEGSKPGVIPNEDPKSPVIQECMDAVKSI
jgi:hypothetical protein